MQEHSLTTGRASKLLGIAMCTFAVVKACVQQIYLYAQREELAHLTGGTMSHASGDSFFIVINLLEPAPWLIVGLLLIVFGNFIQRLLR
jgi:hypothetical protein